MQNFASPEAKFCHPFGRADLGIGAPIWVRDRLEAFAVAALWRNKLSYVIGVNSR
jgi:hypothetical protein